MTSEARHGQGRLALDSASSLSPSSLPILPPSLPSLLPSLCTPSPVYCRSHSCPFLRWRRREFCPLSFPSSPLFYGGGSKDITGAPDDTDNVYDSGGGGSSSSIMVIGVAVIKVMVVGGGGGVSGCGRAFGGSVGCGLSITLWWWK